MEIYVWVTFSAASSCFLLMLKNKYRPSAGMVFQKIGNSFPKNHGKEIGKKNKNSKNLKNPFFAKTSGKAEKTTCFFQNIEVVKEKKIFSLEFEKCVFFQKIFVSILEIDVGNRS